MRAANVLASLTPFNEADNAISADASQQTDADRGSKGKGKARVDEASELSTEQAAQASQNARELLEQGYLPDSWNATGDTYSLRYKHPQSTFTFLVKSVRLANKLVIHGMSVEDGNVHDLQLAIDAAVAPSYSFPVRRSKHQEIWSQYRQQQQQQQQTQTDQLSAQSEQWSSLPFADAFVSQERLEEVLYQFKVKIIQKLIPGLNKPGYEESSSSSSTASAAAAAAGASSSSSSNGRFRDPYGGASRGPYPGGVPMPSGPMGGIGGYPPRGIGGEYGGFGAFPGRNPYGIGDIDRDPFAAAPGILGGGMGGGMHPGGGMYVGPDHPMFGGGRSGRGGMGGMGGYPIGPGGPLYPGPGGPMSLPPGAVPPGARFDPIGPFGPRRGPAYPDPAGQGGGGTPQGGMHPGGDPRFFSGDPDDDHMQPPPPDMYM
eukprot:jgi/Hompol1/5229/HPOL_004311-RA